MLHLEAACARSALPGLEGYSRRVAVLGFGCRKISLATGPCFAGVGAPICMIDYLQNHRFIQNL